MARAKAPPTHPSVWAGLALATVGLLLAAYSYTGARVFDIVFAFVAAGGALLALVGILVAAWGRSILSSRASRARRAVIQEDALALSTPGDAGTGGRSTVFAFGKKGRKEEPTASKGSVFAFGRKAAKREEPEPASGGGVFAFKRRAPEPQRAPDDPRHPEVAARMAEAAPDVAQVEPALGPAPESAVRLTLKCPRCSNRFTAEGVRPFEATCPQCAFSARV